MNRRSTASRCYWRNRTSWEVKDLKKEGILLPTQLAGTGNWTLTDLGWSQARVLLQDQEPGRPYTSPAPPSRLNAAEPFEVDPDLVDRGRTAHHRTVELLAQWVRARGCTPLLPTPTTAQYDLAWIAGRTLNIAEVKSVTESNEERQLRLGLGQVLRYRNLMSVGRLRVVAWLVPERAPADASWFGLCDELGVTLAFPPHFA